MPLDNAGFFDLTQLDMVSELRRQTIVTLEAMGIPVEYSFHELGPSQHEIDLRYTDALTMADNVMTFRQVVKQVANDLGVYATFMPKPIEGAFGSGMHTHLSLFEGDVNAFHDPGDEYGLSKVGKCFIAGLLHHAARDHRDHQPDRQLLQAAHRGLRGAGLRVLGAQQRVGARAACRSPKKGKESSTRIEFRSPDPACNPYLAFSVMLAAGLKGVEEGYELPPEATNNIYEMTPEERAAEGIGVAAAEPRRGDRRSWKNPSSWPKHSGSTCSSTSSATSGQSGATTRRTSRPWELDRYLGSL